LIKPASRVLVDQRFQRTIVIPINFRFVQSEKKHDFTSIPLTENYLNLLEMPGFGPAAELVAWRVPKGVTVVVEAKGPKTIDAPSGLIKVGGRQLLEGGPTRCAHTRTAGSWKRPPMGPGGRRRAAAKEHADKKPLKIIWNNYSSTVSSKSFPVVLLKNS
jgi:hypothetical protein